MKTSPPGVASKRSLKPSLEVPYRSTPTEILTVALVLNSRSACFTNFVPDLFANAMAARKVVHCGSARCSSRKLPRRISLNGCVINCMTDRTHINIEPHRGVAPAFDRPDQVGPSESLRPHRGRLVYHGVVARSSDGEGRGFPFAPSEAPRITGLSDSHGLRRGLNSAGPPGLEKAVGRRQ